MASTDSPKEIVRTVHLPDAGTAESEAYVCADGSVWRRTFSTSPSTSVSFGIKRGNQIHVTSD